MDGDRIRRARHERGYTLADVSKQTGYTASFISQLERNLKEPSLAALRKISDCLGCSVVWLVDDNSKDAADASCAGDEKLSGCFVPTSARRIVTMPDIYTRYEFFTPKSVDGRKPRMTGSCMHLNPKCWVSEKMIVHVDLDESVYLLQGVMEAHLGSKTFRLEPGDNLYILSGTPHNLLNPGDAEAIALVHFAAIMA